MKKPELSIVAVGEAKPYIDPSGANLGILPSPDNRQGLETAASKLRQLFDDNVSLTVYAAARRPSSLQTAERLLADSWVGGHAGPEPLVFRAPVLDDTTFECGDKASRALNFTCQLKSFAASAIAKAAPGKPVGLVLVAGPAVLSRVPELTPYSYQSPVDEAEFLSVNRMVSTQPS